MEVATQKNYDEEKCIVCGHVVRFYEDEYKKSCNYCGTWIFDKVRYRQKQENNSKKQDGKEEKIKCWVCFDRGIVEYPVQHEMGVYNYVARCLCPEGLKWPATIPLLSECQLVPKPEFIELRNRKICGLVWESKEGGTSDG